MPSSYRWLPSSFSANIREFVSASEWMSFARAHALWLGATRADNPYIWAATLFFTILSIRLYGADSDEVRYILT